MINPRRKIEVIFKESVSLLNIAVAEVKAERNCRIKINKS
jgi:hypothetical protein